MYCLIYNNYHPLVNTNKQLPGLFYLLKKLRKLLIYLSNFPSCLSFALIFKFAFNQCLFNLWFLISYFILLIFPILSSTFHNFLNLFPPQLIPPPFIILFHNFPPIFPHSLYICLFPPYISLSPTPLPCKLPTMGLLHIFLRLGGGEINWLFHPPITMFLWILDEVRIRLSCNACQNNYLKLVYILLTLGVEVNKFMATWQGTKGWPGPL